MSGSPSTEKGDESAFRDEFVILDDASASNSTPATPSSSAISHAQPTKGSSLARYTFGALNVVTGCAALATAKNLMNPENFRAREAPKEGLPPWMQERFFSGQALAQRAMRNTLHDTAVLVGAAATYYGTQAAMQTLRGVDDAANPTVAGFLSAGLLGAKLFRPMRVTRAAIFAAIGGTLGYMNWFQMKAVMAKLLERQKMLEQRHLHTAPGHERHELDLPFLRELLLKERAAEAAAAKSQLQQHKVVDEQGRPTDGGGDWKGILDAAPWLQQPEDGHAAQQEQQHSAANDVQQGRGRA